MRITRDFIQDPYLVLYLPLYKLDGASFMSKDAYGRLCTVTGALWTPQGRSFDGADDVINLSNPAALNALTGQQTHMAWIKPTSLGENNNGFILDKSKIRLFIDATNSRYRFEVSASGNKYVLGNDNSCVLGVWKCVFGIFNGANVLLDVDGTTVTGLATVGPVDAHSTDNFLIGDAAASIFCFNGLIGEVISWNRALSAVERNHVRLATKFRYR